MSRLPSIVALVSALVACGALGMLIAVELRSSTPTTSPRESIGQASATRAQARVDRFAAADESWDTTFDNGMVHDRVQWTFSGSPATLDLAIVNATPGADLAATARDCAASQGSKTRVQCYVFANTEAYEFKNISGEMQLKDQTALVNLCWAVLASNEKAGGALTVSDMRDAPATWSAQQCPDSWSGGEGSGA
jgi:hypothetical protein